ncbi:MAG TPA: hypothetical protein PLR99_27810 [Polyangiaceae bacterium]|nr:hypothetical protein [Polyangiaceae bacterium]
MNIVKQVGRFFGGLSVVVAVSALAGCAAETDRDDASDSEEAVVGKSPSYVYVQVGTLTHRRVSLSNGAASVTVPTQAGKPTPALFSGQKLADFGKLTQPTKASELSDNLALWKLSGRLGTAERWKNLASATADIKAIATALDAASGRGCAGGDWHLATFDDDAADFVCATLSDGTKTVGSTKPSGSTGGPSFCDLKATTSAKRTGDTVTLTFFRNGVDETIGGQWYSADGTPWEGAAAGDLYRCPDAKCSVVPTKLTTSKTSVTLTATRLAGRPVKFVSTGGACVYGPY